MTTLFDQIREANIELHRTEAPFYDQITPEIFNAHEQALTRSVIESALRAITSEKIHALDIGSGTGNISRKLAEYERVVSITAVDLSSEMLAEQRRKLSIQEAQKIQFATMDADSFLAQNTKQYTLITASSVLHHLPDYMMSIDSMMHRLLPGGVLCIFHEPTGVSSPVLRAMEWLDSRLFVNLSLPADIRRRAKELDYSLSDYHVFHGFKLQEIREKFSGAGYRELTFVTHNVFKTSMMRTLGKIVPAKNNFILATQRPLT